MGYDSQPAEMLPLNYNSFKGISQPQPCRSAGCGSHLGRGFDSQSPGTQAREVGLCARKRSSIAGVSKRSCLRAALAAPADIHNGSEHRRAPIRNRYAKRTAAVSRRRSKTLQSILTILQGFVLRLHTPEVGDRFLAPRDASKMLPSASRVRRSLGRWFGIRPAHPLTASPSYLTVIKFVG
jgi:hypothetical protein